MCSLVFLFQGFWVKDLAVCGLKFGFYVKFPPWSRILKSGIENLDSRTGSGTKKNKNK